MSKFSHPESGEPHDPVANFSGIPDWVASEPSTHLMVQDRDADKVRFFWGGSGYAELEVLEAAAAGDGDGEEEVRVRFEQLPAPPGMERVRWLLLNPPEFECPEVYYEPFEGDR